MLLARHLPEGHCSGAIRHRVTRFPLMSEEMLSL